MNNKMYLANAIEIAELKAQYDSEAKKIVADKGILSWIIKYTVDELKDCTLDEIADAIEGIEISEVPIYPGKSKRTAKRKTTNQAITGMPTEDKVPNEGEISFDIRFYIITPKGERIKLIINIEIQKDYYPGYDLVPRAIFYCARMLSAQLDTEFATDNYDDIKKVYSIWLCLNSPKDTAGTIVKYQIEPKIVVGKEINNHRYDLMTVVMIGLNNKSFQEKQTQLHGLLGTVFSEKLTPERKLQILNREYGMETSKEAEKGVGRMCNLSDAIEERGLARGLKKGIERGEQQKLIELVCRKVKRGKELSTIAEELEENEDFLLPIYKAVLKTGPDYDSKAAYEIIYDEK